MKKPHLLIGIIFIVPFLFGFFECRAQSSFTITDVSSVNITGTTQTFWIDQDILDARHYTMTNTSSDSINVRVRKTNIQLNTPTAYSTFCTCTNCYGPSTIMSVLFSLAPGGSCDLVADYFPDSTGGIGHLRLSILNQNNLADSATVDFIYNSTPAGINSNVFQKASVSNPAPNPTSSVFAINYKLGSTPVVGAKMVIYNMLGDYVMDQVVREVEGTIRMDVSSLNQGIYFCSLESAGKTLVTRRLVVTH
jgi:hypothetical protein